MVGWGRRSALWWRRGAAVQTLGLLAGRGHLAAPPPGWRGVPRPGLPGQAPQDLSDRAVTHWQLSSQLSSLNCRDDGSTDWCCTLLGSPSPHPIQHSICLFSLSTGSTPPLRPPPRALLSRECNSQRVPGPGWILLLLLHTPLAPTPPHPSPIWTSISLSLRFHPVAARLRLRLPLDISAFPYWRKTKRLLRNLSLVLRSQTFPSPSLARRKDPAFSGPSPQLPRAGQVLSLVARLSQTPPSSSTVKVSCRDLLHLSGRYVHDHLIPSHLAVSPRSWIQQRNPRVRCPFSPPRCLGSVLGAIGRRWFRRL